MYEDEVIEEILDEETGWIQVRTRFYDPSSQPFWLRAKWIWCSREYVGAWESLKLLWQNLWCPPAPPQEVVSLHTQDGAYIGEPGSALVKGIKRHGICPQAGTIGGACCLGFSESEQRWYGWGHRCFISFTVGDRVTSASHPCATSGWDADYLAAHPEKDHRLPVGFVAENMDDARRMAIAFADAIG